MTRLLLALALLLAPPVQAQAQRVRGVPVPPRSRSGISLGLTSVAYDPDTLAYFAAVGAPDQGTAYLFDTQVRCLKSGNGTGNAMWKIKLGSLFEWASWSRTAALTDILRPTHVATAVNSPAFEVGRGVTSDGATSYIDMGETFGAAPTLTAQNAITIGTWAAKGQLYGVSSMTQIATAVGSTTTMAQARLNSSALAQTPVSAPALHIAVSRASASTMRLYVNGVSAGDTTATSTALAMGTEIVALRRQAGYSVPPLIASEYGPPLTDADEATLDACMRPYLSAVGALQ